MQNSIDAINEYLEKDIHTVDGWCDASLWDVIFPISRLIGPGSVAEIGVFEGKFFTGLAKTFGTSPENKACAIDVFDLQEFNLDNAGEGKLRVFQDNLDRLNVGSENVDILKADSLTLGPEDVARLRTDYGGFKFFSIDGCHEMAHTRNDIEFAMATIAPDGIIAVDDFLNPHWPGVGEAVAKMYLMRDYSFVPMAYTKDKLFLCSYSYHKKYLDAIFAYVRNKRTDTRMKIVTRFGYRSLSLIPAAKPWNALVEP